MRKKDLKYWNSFPDSKKEEIMNHFNLTEEGLENSIRFNDDGSFTLDYLKFKYKPNHKYDNLVNEFEKADEFKRLFANNTIPEANNETMNILKDMHNKFYNTTYKYRKFYDKYLWRYRQLLEWLHGLNRDALASSGTLDYITTVRLLSTHLHIFFTDCKMI